MAMIIQNQSLLSTNIITMFRKLNPLVKSKKNNNPSRIVLHKIFLTTIASAFSSQPFFRRRAAATFSLFCSSVNLHFFCFCLFIWKGESRIVKCKILLFIVYGIVYTRNRYEQSTKWENQLEFSLQHEVRYTIIPGWWRRDGLRGGGGERVL